MEIWIPFGNVETLVSVQAEILGEIVEARPDQGSEKYSELATAIENSELLLICDSKPPTLEALKEMKDIIARREGIKIIATNQKAVESISAEFKGKIDSIGDNHERINGELKVPSLFLQDKQKLFLATATPDPMFGVIDARVAMCINWVYGSKRIAYERRVLEPLPYLLTDSYKTLFEISDRVNRSNYFTIIPRGGKVNTIIRDGDLSTISNLFHRQGVSQAKGAIIGAGGYGYDNTLSDSIRVIWGSIPCVKKGGSILLIAECGEGIGSEALNGLLIGRLDWNNKRSEYLDGLEELDYLRKIKDEYNLILLSGLPEFYARTRLGLETAKSSTEALNKLVAKLGRSGKINVVVRSPECYLTQVQ